MYEVRKGDRTILEADACGMGFLAGRTGEPETNLVRYGLGLAKRFDHRGAPGHGAGVTTDIPWPIVLERFPQHAGVVAQRSVALGMFFLPDDDWQEDRAKRAVEELAKVAGLPVLAWADVPVNVSALPPHSPALATRPRVRQALFFRPQDQTTRAWFASRYLLRLAIDEALSEELGDSFSVVSLSNRTVVYKGLCELSRIDAFYPDLRRDDYASRFLLFHSRYCTNTTTAWRRAQPFWAIAHNGEVNTIQGNVKWMSAIGNDLIRKLVKENPELEEIASRVVSIISPFGSDTANLDDMLIALAAGGMTLAEAILALLPEASSAVTEKDPLHEFYRSMGVYLGACDGPAAIVACDGSTAVAHLDRNGLRPLWVEETQDYVFAASELTGTQSIGTTLAQRVLGPGGMVAVDLRTGRVKYDQEAHQMVARSPFRRVEKRIQTAQEEPAPLFAGDLTRLQASFGMTAEDLDVVLEPLMSEAKPAVGSMGDDTPPAALLDELPRRIEDHFKLRFAQETSPPIDPVRDRWVFNVMGITGDRTGLWDGGQGPLFSFDNRIISRGELTWLKARSGVQV
ncbi:MAG: hypothetical protein MH204_10385, partial [Fimbriimonadaceae bacterium]|nr:hypothetical protein [Fimbriimonadaceae bacterium]